MNILFFVPCYEPGKDGVGDYTRRLVGAVQRLAPAVHACRVISWRDGFVSESVQSEHFLRLSVSLSELRKVSITKEWLRDWQLDWISLQWVPYGFHPRGLYWGQIESLSQVIGNYPVHLMVHETWIGAKAGSNPKERLLGYLQKKLFHRLVTQLRPKCIHTQAKAYQYLLSQFGISSSLLPLFGNIQPVAPPMRDNSLLRCGFFGALHESIDLNQLLPQLIELGAEQEKKVQILHAGRVGDGAILQWEQWKQQWLGKVEFHRMGELNEQEVSRYLHSLDFGLSTNPLALLDKSGSIAAMVEHGLTVVNLRDDVQYEGFTPLFASETFLHRPSLPQLREAMQRTGNKSECTTQLELVARQFHSALTVSSE